jgi:hypothetical protein
MGAVLQRDFGTSVGRAGIGNDNFIEDAADTIKTTRQRGRAVFDNHGQLKGGHLPIVRYWTSSLHTTFAAAMRRTA